MKEEKGRLKDLLRKKEIKKRNIKKGIT